MGSGLAREILGHVAPLCHAAENQRGVTEQWRGREYRVEYLSKVWLVLVVDDSHAEQVIDTILENAGTGEIGDGKIFLSNVEDVIRVRTRERGEAAI